MQADEQTVQTVAALFAKSLNFRESKEAEAQLRGLESNAGFSLVLLSTISSAALPLDVRLAAALFFKNLIKRRWTDADGNYLLPAEEVAMIKSGLLDLMISSPPQVSKQLGEAVAHIANSDFPERWENLVPELVAKLDVNNAAQCNAVLSVAHAVFERWRTLERSDPLFLEIKLVLQQFAQPFLAFMVEADARVSATGSVQWYESMNLLFQIFYDLNCQDLPEFFEDHIEQFMNFLLKYLSFEIPAGAEQNDEEDAATVYENVRTSVCEAIALYTERYEEEFAPYMPNFVQAGWTLLTTTGVAQRFDLLVNRCLAFLTSVARFERNLSLFSNEQTLVQIIERIVIPNLRMRESDLEAFEDEPLDFIRQDQEGSDSSTRRHASQVFLRELAAKMEREVTEIVMRYITQFNNDCKAAPAERWLEKSAATALFTSVAAKGQITQAGVSSTNPLLDSVQYFQTNLVADLASGTASHPVLKADAVRFLLHFRTQLSKEQIVQVFPVITQLLSTTEHAAVYTYAAICLERLLALRDPASASQRPMFGEQDLVGHARAMATQTLKIIASGSTRPEELAANEFLMRLLMRILVVANTEVKHFASVVVPQLVNIIVAVSSNPSNPRFNHYLFESLGACLKHYTDYSALSSGVIQPLFAILGSDVTEFVPYILQILTEILQLQPAESGLPESYQQLLKPVLSPQLWETRGNVPALVGLLEVIVKRGPSLVIEMNLLMPLLGVFQNLLASSARDQHTFELLQQILTSIPAPSLAPYVPQIGKLLLMRLQKGRTDKYGLFLTRFIFGLAATPETVLGGAQFVIDLFDRADPTNRPQAFGDIFANIVLGKTLQIHGSQNRRVASVGLTNLLCGTTQFVSGKYSAHWQSGIVQLVKLLTQSVAEESGAANVDFDVNDLVFGATFSPLSTTKVAPPDPLAYLGATPESYFAQAFRKIAQEPSIQQQLGGVPEDVKQYLIGIVNK